MMGGHFLHNVYANSSMGKDPMICKQYLSNINYTKLDYISNFRRLHLHNVIFGLLFGSVNVSIGLTSWSSVSLCRKAKFAMIGLLLSMNFQPFLRSAVMVIDQDRHGRISNKSISFMHLFISMKHDILSIVDVYVWHRIPLL